MSPTLIGYFPKRTLRHPDFLPDTGVVEICSVSNCISKDPDEWINHWRHNEMWTYDNAEAAWSVVPDEVREAFDLYAYSLFPVRFTRAGEEAFAIPAVNPVTLGAEFSRLGFDAVSRSYDSTFECSPLSCNYLAREVPTNRHCLLDTAEAALELAANCEAKQCEPGPYHVVEVWRQEPPSNHAHAD